MKAVVKLPPRQQNSFEAPQCLVSRELYFEDPDHRVTDYNLRYILQDYSLLEIKREHNGGFLSFPDSKIAERVYSLYNGYIFNNNAALKFKLSYSDLDDPQPQGPVLEVNHLPAHINHNTLYDIFRPFGPMSICKSITEHGGHRGKALIQYFGREDSDSAQENMDNKYYGGNPISISVFMPNVPKPTHTFTNESNNNSYVDYLNLYVKNLDPEVDNNELFSLFKTYGRIVSARVMTHPATGQSKGYGFVSYGSPDEAAFALEQLNGFPLRGRALLVNYHETKKPRQENSTSTTTSSFHSPPAVDYLQTSYDNYQVTNDYLETTDPLSIRELSIGAIPVKSIVEPKFSPPTSNRPSLASLASGATIQMAPVQESNNKVINEYEPKRTLRRRGSLESISSVMTETSAQVQRQKITEAVRSARGDFNETMVNDVVDMLLTLKRKDRSLCLFNPDFLKEKIEAALEALEICEEDILEEEKVVEEDKKASRSFLDNIRPFVPAVRNTFSPPKDVVIPPRASRAIPIVAPVIPAEHSSEIKALFETFKGKPIHEQKQLLGDRLFPLVKETGTKQAPKVTIRLLDTIPLEELAQLMYNKEEFKKRVESTYFVLNPPTNTTITT